MHLSENTLPLTVHYVEDPLRNAVVTTPNVEFIVLPYFETLGSVPDKKGLYERLSEFINHADNQSTSP